MKRPACALSLLLLALGTLRAQPSPAGPTAGAEVGAAKATISLKFGLSCGRLKGAGSGLERQGGVGAGFLLTVRLTDRLSLVPELTPGLRKGASNIPFDSTGDPELDPFFGELANSALLLSYVDIPVQVTYRLGRFKLGAGPFVGFLSSAYERFESGLEAGGDVTYKRKVTAQYKGLDYGLVFEASVDVTRPRGREGLVVHVRYQAGLADILLDPSADVRTMGVQIFVSFPFIRIF